MVGVFDFLHSTIIGLDIRRAQDIIDAEPKHILIVGDTQTATGLAKGIQQPALHGMVCVRYGRIVEVAADDDVIRLRLPDFLRHLFGLRGTGAESGTQLLADGSLQVVEVLDVHRLEEIGVARAVFRSEFERFQVVVD